LNVHRAIPLVLASAALAVATTYAVSAALIFRHLRDGDGRNGRVAFRTVGFGGAAAAGGWADPHHIVLAIWPNEAGRDTLVDVNLRYAPQSDRPLPPVSSMPQRPAGTDPADYFWTAVESGTYPGLLGGLRDDFDREVIGAHRLLMVEASGWPCIALRTHRVGGGPLHEPFDAVAAAGMTNRDGWMVPVYDWRIPNWPVWPGFAVNAGLAFAFWMMLSLTTGSLRRRITGRVRAFRRRCPGCGYSRAGIPAHSPCPECGAPSAAACASA